MVPDGGFPQFASNSGASGKASQPSMIQHVTREIPASALEQCTRFYEILGFVQVTAPPDIARRARWLERSGTQIHLMPTADALPSSGHVGIVVEPYTETVARLRDDGHEVERRREHWGSPRSYVRDPAGHLVELMAWAPGTDGPGPSRIERDRPPQQEQ